jgi:hypothetical protein
MPIPRYQLDDLDFQELVQEMVARIPAHTPEWTNPQEGDPGHTIIDLFAWLADTLLYRVNLIPERQRLEFLRLLNRPVRPALSASGLVALEPAKDKPVQAVTVPRYTAVSGPAVFETDDEITVFPLTGKVFVKRRPTAVEQKAFAEIQRELEGIYDIETSAPYVTTALFQESVLDPGGIDIAKETIDQSAWIALLAEDPGKIEKVRNSFKADAHGKKMINIGFAPRLSIPQFGENVHRTIAMDEIWQWEMPSARKDTTDTPYAIPYLSLDLKEDTTAGFARQGLIKLELPSPKRIGLPPNSVDDNIYAGTGNLPPRIDNEGEAKRLVTWIRLRPKQPSESLPVRWMGVNAVSIDQRRTIHDVVIATSNGTADQSLQLPAASVETASFELQVEETGVGYKTWRNQPLATATPHDRVYELDGEAGTVTFGDGLRGRMPETASRVRIRTMRYGGGKSGNLAAGNLTGIAFPHLKLVQAVETTGGVDAETLEEAEKRIPGELRHRNRAITEEDYAFLARGTPGVQLARVEVLPKFKPQQRISGLIGVISVMVLPQAASHRPPNPRPDRNMLARVHAYLEVRRPIGVELYVIGTEYVALGLGIAVSIREGFARHQVMQDVQDALREFLWPLPPGGHRQKGWQLGRSVINHELEVVVARVKGILTVNDINMFHLNESQNWEMLSGEDLLSLALELWQLPELLTVVVAEGTDAPTEIHDEYGLIEGAGDGVLAPADKNIPIPVVPEICR